MVGRIQPARNHTELSNTRRYTQHHLHNPPKMCGGYKKGENPSALGKNKIQWITDLPAGLRGRVILGKGMI